MARGAGQGRDGHCGAGLTRLCHDPRLVWVELCVSLDFVASFACGEGVEPGDL